MRKTLSVLAALAIVAPLGAQQQAAKDPTTAVASAPLPEGWSMKLDPQAASMTAKFVAAGQGFHVTSGGAAIYYNAKDAQGNTPYSVMANFRQTKKITEHGAAGEAYGLFIAGHNVDDSAKQTYFYFLVRQDGKFLINHRAGPEVHKLVDWTANPAIKKFDDAPNASNDLAIKIDADSLHFLVNNTQVHAISRKEITDVSGQAGFRVNHNLDVQIGNYMVMK